ncbi:hypothetical protein S40293_05607 [Stachybotrys chartarum IBT 40293]|nr:hypothetical protein S40293_05607 [Stachybotrys chartarum IBT 40293]
MASQPTLGWPTGIPSSPLRLPPIRDLGFSWSSTTHRQHNLVQQQQQVTNTTQSPHDPLHGQPDRVKEWYYGAAHERSRLPSMPLPMQTSVLAPPNLPPHMHSLHSYRLDHPAPREIHPTPSLSPPRRTGAGSNSTPLQPVLNASLLQRRRLSATSHAARRGSRGSGAVKKKQPANSRPPKQQHKSKTGPDKKSHGTKSSSINDTLTKAPGKAPCAPRPSSRFSPYLLRPSIPRRASLPNPSPSRQPTASPTTTLRRVSYPSTTFSLAPRCPHGRRPSHHIQLTPDMAIQLPPDVPFLERTLPSLSGHPGYVDLDAAPPTCIEDVNAELQRRGNYQAILMQYSRWNVEVMQRLGTTLAAARTTKKPCQEA